MFLRGARVTVCLIKEGLSRLRTVAGKSSDARTTRVLWRGMRNLQLQDRFTTGEVQARVGQNITFLYVL